MEILHNTGFWIFIAITSSALNIYLFCIILGKDRDDDEAVNEVASQLFDVDLFTKADCLECIRQCNEGIGVLKKRKQQAASILVEIRK